MHEERDQQRSKLYKAERIALETMSSPLPTIKDIELYLNKVFAKAPIQRRFGKYLNRQIEVRDGRGRLKAGGCAAYITIPVGEDKWGRHQWVVLHEIAHSITQRKYGMKPAAHGWQFAAIYLDLVRFGMSKEAHDALKASFKAHKVRFTEKKTRKATPEMIERLAKARAMRKAA